MASNVDVNGLKLGEFPEAEMVGIEVIPIGQDTDQCTGCIVKLTKNEGHDDEIVLAAGMSAAQCREIAIRLMTIADAVSGGSERTMVCVTSKEMWKQAGQVLLVRCVPPDMRPHFEFAVKPEGRLNLPKRKLIIP
jgi:hypothetical protein